MRNVRAAAARFGALLTALAQAPGGVEPKGWRNWAALIALMGGATALALVSLPAVLDLHAAFVLLLVWVALAALLGGLWGGLAAAAAGLVLGLALGGARGFSDGGEALAFAALAVALSAAGHVMWRSRLRRESAARVLEQREAHLRSIFDSSPEAMIVIDENGVVQAYGGSAERMFGWRPSAVLGRKISMLMPQPFRDQHDGYLKRYLATGERRIIGIGRVVVGLRANGAIFPMELTVAEVRSPSGRSFTGFVRDLTTHAEREHKVEELQAEIVHISRLNAMGEMASSLAHELNQPLSAIANYLNGARQILARGGQSAAMEGVEKAAEQALRAGEIIRRMRDFLARGEGERTLESLGKLVHEACALALGGPRRTASRCAMTSTPILIACLSIVSRCSR
jgi:two-component system, LuxR family, sensor kinase FixL